MAKYSPPMIAFNAGEWGPLTYGRVDLPKFISSTRTMDNFLPTVQGAVRKRGGTQFKNNRVGENTRFIPFRVSRTQSFMLAVDTVESIVFDQDGNELDSLIPGLNGFPWKTVEQLESMQFAQTGNFLTFIGDGFIPTFFNWDGVTQTFTPLFDQLPRTVMPVQRVLEPTVLITGDDFVGGTLISDTPIFEPEMALDSLEFAEVAQVIGVFNEPKQEYNAWVTGTVYANNDMVYGDSINTPGRVNAYLSIGGGTSGGIPPTHDFGLVNDADDGSGVEWAQVHDQVAFIRINTFVNSQEVTYQTASTTGRMPPSFVAGTRTWAFGSWSNTFGYPRTGTFFQQRLLLGGTFTEPQTFQGSAVGDFANYAVVSVADDQSFSYQIESDENNRIGFMLGARSLLIGTEGGEFNATGGVQSDAITPTAISIARDSKFGSHPQNAIQAGEAILFVQAGRQTLRESIFNRDQDGNIAADLSLLAHHIAGDGIGRIAFQKEPDAIMWSYNVREGQLIGMTYERQQEVVGWHRHTLGGLDPVVTDVQTLPGPGGTADRLWLIVARFIDGQTRYYMEIMEDISADLYSDSFFVYDDVPTTTITGLGHLEGETVSVIADGANTPQQVVVGGEIELEFEASRVVVGLPYIARLTTQTIEGGSADGVSQGKAKRVHNASFRLVTTALGLEVGTNPDRMTKVIYRITPDLMNTPVPLFTGDTEIAPIEGSYDDRAIIFVTHDVALPCIINAIWPQLEVYDAR